MTAKLPVRGTPEYEWYWTFGICRDRGRCGRPKDEEHEVHIQYDAGNEVLDTWWDSSHYRPIELVK
ncbi:hypothetical protein [Kribbella sp. NPDC051620]|uniref:hypothetical protein n=1 Tax=Kribbella sp. NPDC051620 TaxID=3364120 RepID=UPI0037A1E13F